MAAPGNRHLVSANYFDQGGTAIYIVRARPSRQHELPAEKWASANLAARRTPYGGLPDGRTRRAGILGKNIDAADCAGRDIAGNLRRARRSAASNQNNPVKFATAHRTT
jgi:hypothetical protein